MCETPIAAPAVKRLGGDGETPGPDVIGPQAPTSTPGGGGEDDDEDEGGGTDMILILILIGVFGVSSMLSAWFRRRAVDVLVLVLVRSAAVAVAVAVGVLVLVLEEVEEVVVVWLMVCVLSWSLPL
eukprot:1634087-Rhodomonas_salina.1